MKIIHDWEGFDHFVLKFKICLLIAYRLIELEQKLNWNNVVEVNVEGTMGVELCEYFYNGVDDGVLFVGGKRKGICLVDKSI